MMSGRWQRMKRVAALWGSGHGWSRVAGGSCRRAVVLGTWLAGSLLAGSLLSGAALRAAGPVALPQEAVIEVSSQGAIEVAPDIIWIEGRLSGSGDLPEAQKIVAGLKGDIGKALGDPDFASVKVEYSRRSVKAGGNSPEEIQRQMMQMMGEGPADAGGTSDFSVSEDFRLVLTGLTPENFEEATGRMLKLAAELHDRQIKLGKQTGMNPYNPYGDGLNAGQFLRVGLADAAAVWQSASQAAFANAQSQAKSLAEIAGGKLGPALSISTESPGLAAEDESIGGLQELLIAQYSGVSSATRSEVSRTTLDKIPVRVTLRVRFAFQPAGS